MRVRVSAAILLASTFFWGCGDESKPSVGPAPCLSRSMTAATTPIPAAELAALDPSGCPPSIQEDARGSEPRVALTEGESLLASKAFYLLTLFEVQQRDLGAAMCLNGICDERRAALAHAKGSCGSDTACWGQALLWSDADIARVGEGLVSLHAMEGSSPRIAAIGAELRASGHAHLFADASDDELLHHSWEFTARALNQAWADHVARLPWETLGPLLNEAATSEVGSFFQPLLNLVLAALQAEGRDEAVRYEPLAGGENAATIAQLHCIDFARYPFAAIVVPGQGPNDLDHPLDPTGQTRADQAASRFAAGLAPLIALSGGHVHPDRTPYSEAIEMKRYLMDAYGIPEWVILVDPHARHTTTNLRNVGRLFYRYGISVDQPSLITSDQFQIAYIAFSGPTQLFGKRNLDELGYLPYRGIRKLGLVDDCWFPSVASLFSDPRDLLDP